MLTRIEIDGFKSFHGFRLDLRPFTAIVGPNASGKSNLFDALRFLSRLAQHDIRTAMQDLRGRPEELFRKTAAGVESTMTFAIEVLLDHGGVDAFGSRYETPARRLRYELILELERGQGDAPRGVFVRHERCEPISKQDDTAREIVGADVAYNARYAPFIETEGARTIVVRQDGSRDGAKKRGRPVQLPLTEATRSALSTITTSEFRHLYALRDEMSNMRFLEINPRAARTGGRHIEYSVGQRAETYCQAIHRVRGWRRERCASITRRRGDRLSGTAFHDRTPGGRGRGRADGRPQGGDFRRRPESSRPPAAPAADPPFSRHRPAAGFPSPARGSRSFKPYEADLRRALASLGRIEGS